MFTALVNFIQYHITETIMAFFAPILKHCTVDGYVLNFYFIILEFSETYGIITIAFLFTILMIYYRNTIFNVYKEIVYRVIFFFFFVIFSFIL